MIEQLNELTEQLAAAVMSVDLADLPALAGLHSQFQAVAQLMRDLSAGAEKGIAVAMPAVSGAEKLIERIILEEVDDAAAAMRTITDTVSQLQRMVQDVANGRTPEPAASLATGVAAAPSALPASPAASAPAPVPAAAGSSEPPNDDATRISTDDAPLVAEFIGEANGHIESAEAEILKLEENPGDAEAINAIFRSFHTIKGVAGFLNLKQIGALAHAAENLLDLCRHGQMEVSAPLIDIVLESSDVMKTLVSSLAEAIGGGQPLPRCAKLPDLLRRLVACAAGQQGAAAASSAAASAPASSPAATAPTVKAADAAPAANKGAVQAAAQEATVKVATDRLDNLINMVGELVIAQAMVSQDMVSMMANDQRLSRNMGQLGKITRELQDLSMSMRMVPIHGVFQKMARLVRDLSRKGGKEIEFAMVGSETELDRNVVEAISDPLVHMVRNSVDHGIEGPEDRQKAGKPRAGHVTLKAYHQAGNIVIEIIDDGRGLNKGKILKKAGQAGIIKEGQELSEQEIFRLIFHAGLSTADKITEISGRGVGMDVVKRNVEALRGRIEIASVEGQGSTFTIRLPLTLAVIDGLVVKVGGERFILPITSIEQSIRPKSEQLSTVQNRGEMCMVRGALLPLFRLYSLFAVKPLTEDPTQALVVIVQDNDRRCCLLVDELLGQQQVVIKSLGEGVGAVRGVSGGAILGDGNVSLILDVPGLMDLAAA